MEEQVQISLPATLVEELSQAASTRHTDLTAVLTQAIEHYLREQAQHAIEREQREYAAQHSQLVAQYKGEYIAMYDGEVVDHDADRAALGRRVRARYGRAPVLITPVLAQPRQVITVRRVW
jgi:predicted transcriptional regulator